MGRDYRGRRWLKIGLRTCHIVAFSALVGGLLLDSSIERVEPWFLATILSGFALVAVELQQGLIWLRQLRGIAIFVKLLVLSAAFYWPQHHFLVISAIILSSVVSHMPGRYRYWVLTGPSE